MASQSLDEMMERTHSLLTTLLDKVYLAKYLQEVSRELRYDNSDLREFLREQRLRGQTLAQGMHERWVGGATASPRKHDSASKPLS